MAFTEIAFFPIPGENDREILISELIGLGFDSFFEEPDGLKAYIEEEKLPDDLAARLVFVASHPGIQILSKPMEEKNWNEEWERNYDPVVIAGKCHVRAPFHPSRPEFPLEIVIEPKMSFGTAHHDTTRMMAEWLLEMDLKSKNVLDMGCGTGILAILAHKLGAAQVTGIDNDEWACRNATENFAMNGTSGGQVIPGDASSLHDRQFDVILANINRNILLADMPAYARSLAPGGWIAFSGFLPADNDAIRKSACDHGLQYRDGKISGNWASLLFFK
jgi:ribosomal protein L11 methyltransferase